MLFKNNSKLILSLVYIILSCSLVSFSIVDAQNNKIQATQETKASQSTTKKPATTKAPTTTQAPVTQAVTQVAATAAKPKAVKLACTTVKNDLKIKLVDSSSGKYITGVAFAADVTDSSGNKKTYTDKDVNGYIYLSNVKAGDYSVKLNALSGYTVALDTVTINVKDKVAYKTIQSQDINDKVNKTPDKTQDTKPATPQGSTLKDTVEFVESSKTLVPEQTNYIAVDPSNVKNPNQTTTTTTTTSDTTTSGTTNGETTTKDNNLYDNDGNKLYVKSGDSYVPATADSYSSSTTYYKQEIVPAYYKYTGWQNIDSKRYYYNKNNNYVTGNQVISGAKYSFGSDGVLQPGSPVLGIDVSYYQGTIDWQKVKASGVQYVIIRVGYRGWGSAGSLNEDSKDNAIFKQNIAGATKAGLDVGIYFFSQATTEVEAVEEASFCINRVGGYNIKYPIFIDTERSGGNPGRADNLSPAQRTLVCKAFCETIRNAGYKAGIYASCAWFNNNLYASQLNQYYIWLAEWNSSVTYKGKYDMWQYSSKGDGKSFGVSSKYLDMDLSYMTF